MQQVNLYLAELRPKKDWFSAKYLSVVLVGALFILIMMHYSKSYSVGELQIELEEKKLVLNGLETELDISRDNKKPSSREDIEMSIEQLEKKIKSRERLYQLIKGQTLGEDFSFYSAFNAMANKASRNVAMTQFTFSEGGKFIEIKGEGLNAYDIPKYLGALRKENVFSNSQFGLMTIGNIKPDGKVDFSMGYDGSPSFSSLVKK